MREVGFWGIAVVVGLPLGYLGWALVWAVTDGACSVPVLGWWFCSGPGGLPAGQWSINKFLSLLVLLPAGVVGVRHLLDEWFPLDHFD